MDSANYRHVVAQIKKSSPLPHYIYPSYNHLSIDTLLQLCDENSFLSSVPCYRPFEYEVKSSLVLLPGSNPVDDAMDLVRMKIRWERNLNSMKLHDLNSVIKSLKIIRSEPNKVPASIKKYIRHFYNDPEPNFNGPYNWLYTGGTVTSVEETDGTALICFDYSGYKPGINIVKLNESLDKVEYQSFHELRSLSPILQITCRAEPEKLLLCVRQKNQVTLFRIDGLTAPTKPTKIWRKKTLHHKLITFIDISADCENASIADSNHDVHVINIESGNKTFGVVGRKFVPDTVADRWGQVTFGELGLFVAFRDRLHVFDVRDVERRPKISFDPSAATNDCEGISCVTPCIDNNYLYLSTTHHLLQVDLRNQKPVQKWTHMMKSPPQFTSSTQLGERELLVLQSWKLDEVVGVTNDRLSDDCFLSKSLPCLLRSPKESLSSLRCQGTCLNPFLAERVNFAITGARCLKNKRGGISAFVQNSGGDVFLNKIRKKTCDESVDLEEEREATKSAKAWESHWEKFRGRTGCNTFETLNMDHVLEELKFDEWNVEPWKKPEESWDRHEIFAPESLSFCRDVLAQDILKVWGYGPAETDQEDEIKRAHEKVLKWMAKT